MRFGFSQPLALALLALGAVMPALGGCPYARISDIYRVRPDRSDLQLLLGTSSMGDLAMLSPDGRYDAFDSTAHGFWANIWVLKSETGHRWNVTDTPAVYCAGHLEVVVK
ncbi:hypothetical protein BJX64DRAFT_291528 [Aspergillus heterothallicus]